VYMWNSVLTELYSPAQMQGAHPNATNMALTNSLVQKYGRGPAAMHMGISTNSSNTPKLHSTT